MANEENKARRALTIQSSQVPAIRASLVRRGLEEIESQRPVQWDIIRTEPGVRTRGLAFPAFIHNGPYHYVSISAYADGLIDCWGSVDLAMFRQTLKRGWVVTGAPTGAELSFHNLGWAKIGACKWECTDANLLGQIEAGIIHLNPSRTGLIDMHGEETWLTKGEPYRTDVNGEEILGACITVFVGSAPHIYLKPWFIYADGSSRVGSTGDLSTVGEVAKRFDSGELGTSAPEGAHVTIEGLGTFESHESEWYVKPKERVREAFDILAMLQGEPGSKRNCIKYFKEYEANPSDEARERLREAYEAVPEHLREYCGDMGSKDQPIRKILYGKAIEEWMWIGS